MSVFDIADRQSGPPREDVPIPSQPPYTAFVGNLAFDLTETELGEFFAGTKACCDLIGSCAQLNSSRLGEVCQNNQGQRRKAERVRLYRI